MKYRDVKLNTHIRLVQRSNNAWSYTSTPPNVFMAWCLSKHRDNFTFYIFVTRTIIPSATLILRTAISSQRLTFVHVFSGPFRLEIEPQNTTLSYGYAIEGHCVCVCVCMYVRTYVREPFEKFVDWRQCAAVMQREAVTCAKV
jgi:hypothetical protein